MPPSFLLNFLLPTHPGCVSVSNSPLQSLISRVSLGVIMSATQPGVNTYNLFLAYKEPPVVANNFVTDLQKLIVTVTLSPSHKHTLNHRTLWLCRGVCLS